MDRCVGVGVVFVGVVGVGRRSRRSVGAFFTDLLSELLLRATHAAAVSSPASRHRDPPLAIAVADMERR